MGMCRKARNEKAMDRMVRRQHEKNRLTAMGMLLGADWYEHGGVFIKTNPLNFHTTYYNRNGQEVSASWRVRKGKR